MGLVATMWVLCTPLLIGGVIFIYFAYKDKPNICAA